MAKKDAIFDYTSHFDTGPYLADIQATWTANAARITNIRHDINFAGDPGATPRVTPVAGWEEGMWKNLSIWDIVNEPAYLTRDTDNKNKLDFTAVHRLIRNIKSTFNLPNPIDVATWPDEYNCVPTEQQFLWLTDKDRGSEPMALSFAGGGMIHDPLHQTLDQDADKHIKCGLFIPISGWSDAGVDDNTGSWTVRPTATNATTFKAHYQALEDANTAAADYTDPTLVGSEFTQTGEIVLINLENQYRPTPQTYTEDSLMLMITWCNYTYSDIKTLMDAAVA
jgi:hypothetical protein